MKTPGPCFFSEPWGFLLADHTAVAPLPNTEIRGDGSPRAVLPLECHFEWEGGIGIGPSAGIPFRWKGKRYKYAHLPLNHKPCATNENVLHGWRVPADGSEGVVCQTGVLARPLEIGLAENPAARRQNQFIDWLVHSFQEQGHDHLEQGEARAGGLVRRSWVNVTALWLRPDTTEPKMELIIKMAQDTALIKALESISQAPRRILLRRREQTPISRVKEMDSACIRNFARLPGETAIQKAGSRQVLLAVQREASHSTLENRVTCWTLEALKYRAERWRRLQVHQSQGSIRAKNVIRLAKLSADYRNDPNFDDVATGTLAHPVAANYPLMMESRYKRVYRAYRELLRYEKIKDDAWIWRRVLWAEGVSQLVSCTLREIFGESHTSSPYYRTEPDRGRWMVSPCSPGPFETPQGTAYLLNFHDFESIAPTALNASTSASFSDRILESIGVLGCDLALWWPERHAIVPIWSILWTGSDSDWESLLGRAASAIKRFGLQLKNDGLPAQRIRGLVLGTSPTRNDFDLQTKGDADSTVVGIPFPMAIDTQDASKFGALIENLKTAIVLALEVKK